MKSRDVRTYLFVSGILGFFALLLIGCAIFAMTIFNEDYEITFFFDSLPYFYGGFTFCVSLIISAVVWEKTEKKETKA